MSATTSAAVAAVPLSRGAPTMAITLAELEALRQAGEATGTLTGLSAIAARLLGAVVQSTQDSAAHLATIATPFSGSSGVLATQGSFDDATIGRFADAVTKVVQTTIQPQFDTQHAAATRLEDRVKTAEGALVHLHGEVETLRMRLHEAREEAARDMRAEFEILLGRMERMREELVQLSMAEYRVTTARVQADIEQLVVRLAKVEEHCAAPAPGESHEGERPPRRRP